MGNTCCSAGAGNAENEAVRKNPQHISNLKQPVADSTPATPLHPGSGGQTGGSLPVLQTRSSLGWHSADEGVGSDTEEEWHDALSEIDLAEVLEEWEEQQHTHVAEVDRAIQVSMRAL